MMKKMRLFRRITATAMVFAMVGITSAFAASSESYGSMTNGKGEIDHIILNDVLPEEEKFHYFNVKNGSIDKTIRIETRGNYKLAIRNNSGNVISVSGYVKY